MQECFSDLGYTPEDLPESLLASKETIALPIYPDLTAEQCEHVTSTIIEWVSARSTINA
jgi:dTDP-4-amino-4,6-dideoxygalactose transaminase